ncbi:hypothetical protein ACH4OY_15695 [Micromonospora rubida]|uniref:Uncharacterized protein n=1 Tax=Micromonospora rubida TaxID=2697657 RepID=A0ABW7SMI9_9ACTN
MPHIDFLHFLFIITHCKINSAEGLAVEHMESLADEFIQFVCEKNYTTEDFSEMLDMWALQGNAVEMTGGNFILWVQTVFFLRESPHVAEALKRDDLKIFFKKGVPDPLNPLVWDYYVSKHAAVMTCRAQAPSQD